LLDANIIIELHRLGVWHQILVQCQVFTTDCIAHNESLYYSAKNTNIPIDLGKNIDDGSLTIIEATIEDIASLEDIYDADFLQSLHDGEKEALAVIATGKHRDSLFCTADGPAIKALVMLNKGQIGISLEDLLTKNGFTKQVSTIRPWCTKRWYGLRATEGAHNLVNHEGLRKI
jgi:hypothetical protein